MRIAIDARAWGWTGVGRYIRALVWEYAKMRTPHTFVLLLSNIAALEEAQALVTPLSSPLSPLRPGASRGVAGGKANFEFKIISGSYYSWEEQLVLPFQLAKVKADIFHFPHFNVPLFFKRPYVVTIHDATRFFFPGQARQGLFNQLAYEAVFTRAVRGARKVICVSQHTSSELATLKLQEPPLGTPLSGGRGEKASVIREGVDDIFFQPVTKEQREKIRALLTTQDPYLLVVGVWMGHKNIPRILHAFAQVLKKYPALKLVVTGRHKPGYVDVPGLARSYGIAQSVVLPGFFPDELLPALYAESKMLLFPSLYEGFGLPALEAAAAGTPVLAANISSLPEVMGETAEYVNPEDVRDIVRGVTSIMAGGQKHQQYIAAGRIRAREFSWNACAEQTLVVYEEVVSNIAPYLKEGIMSARNSDSQWGSGVPNDSQPPERGMDESGIDLDVWDKTQGLFTWATYIIAALSLPVIAAIIWWVILPQMGP